MLCYCGANTKKYDHSIACSFLSYEIKWRTTMRSKIESMLDSMEEHIAELRAELKRQSYAYDE